MANETDNGTYGGVTERMDTPTGEKDPVSAAPGRAGTGENGREPAAPVTGSVRKKTGEPAAQSREENAKYAAARRKAEAERDRAREQADVVEPVQGHQMKDPVGQAAATTPEQLAAQKGPTQRESEERGADQPMRGFAEAKTALQEVMAQVVDRAAKTDISRAMQEIQAMNTDVKSFEDLAHIPEYTKLLALVEQGADLVDAYKLACFETLQSKQVAAARQAARNAAAGKAHLKPTKLQGTTAPVVPVAVQQQYHKLMPALSDSEIRKHYESYAQGG